MNNIRVFIPKFVMKHWPLAMLPSILSAVLLGLLAGACKGNSRPTPASTPSQAHVVATSFPLPHFDCDRDSDTAAHAYPSSTDRNFHSHCHSPPTDRSNLDTYTSRHA